MIKCPKCQEEAVEVIFTTFRYWYCRKCKEEVPEKEDKKDDFDEKYKNGWFWG